MMNETFEILMKLEQKKVDFFEQLWPQKPKVDDWDFPDQKIPFNHYYKRFQRSCDGDAATFIHTLRPNDRARLIVALGSVNVEQVTTLVACYVWFRNSTGFCDGLYCKAKEAWKSDYIPKDRYMLLWNFLPEREQVDWISGRNYTDL